MAIATSLPLLALWLVVGRRGEGHWFRLYDLAGGVWEYTNGNYVTGSGATAAVYTPTNASAGYTSLVDMFQTDASYYIPYFDAYPNPPLTSSYRTDIVNGYYGANGFDYPDNAHWRIYNNKLGLGHGIFEAVGWSGAVARSVDAGGPWVVRGDYALGTVYAAVASIANTTGGAESHSGGRCIGRGFHRRLQEVM